MFASFTEDIYLVSGYRTPFGKFGGSLSDLTPTDLGHLAGQALLNEYSQLKNEIGQIIFANVLMSTPETSYSSRHIGLRLGLDQKIPGYSINRLCGSGLEAIAQACFQIQNKLTSAVLVTGAEAMSMAPHMLYGARFGTKYGSLPSRDLLLDTLTDKHINCPMGITAENLAQENAVTRVEAEEFSFQSHRKAVVAYEKNLIQPEITPVSFKKGTLLRDEHLRDDISLDELKKLKSSFKPDGTVTPATASGIVDGGAAILLVNQELVTKYKLKPLAKIKAYSVVGVDPSKMGMGPVPAVLEILNNTQLKIPDIEAWEINEAFAAQVISCQKMLGFDSTKLNRWGGAVALGHPLGATGIKISLTLARQLNHYNEKRGIASACIGGGQGIALLLEHG